MSNNVKVYQDLLDAIHASGRPFDLEMIDKAYHLAESAHAGQLRRSGDPYISHPIAAACILVELGMDSECVEAGLLHDVVEDTSVSLQEITRQFGPSVAHLIDGVTKLGKIPYHSREEEQAENIRKMLIAMADDIRVIIIKLADRLHNMRTLQFMSPQKQRDKALENMEIFAPIAHRLGIRTVKDELEDISLRYLDPMGYAEIETNLAMNREKRESFIAEIEEQILQRMKPIIPKVYVEGRVKSINGIYRKVFIQGRNMDEIFDVYAIRVIVDTVNDCYNALGVVHDLYRPLPDRFKDYISTPKPNLYQSLHTTVLSREGGIPFEVQIRTWEMHHMAEYGIAAHWKYKLGLSNAKCDTLEENLTWIRQMLENQNSDDATDLVKTIKNDLSQETVFVFTPTGDVISLPVGSTAIDFAYAIHSAVGNRMIGAKVNGRIVPIDTVMNNGDRVEIMTTKGSGEPRRDWLKIVRTSEAKNKIRQWFKRECRDENIQVGRSEVERELRRSGISFTDEELAVILSNTLKKKNCNSMDDLFCAIGYGGIALSSIMPRIKEEYYKKKNRDAVERRATTPPPQNHTQSRRGGSNGILVDGMENCLTKLAKCCSPLPGDDIIGFITRGFGVSIHKRECSNVPHDLSTVEEPERWVSAHWVGDVHEKFVATLEIVSENRSSVLMEVTQQFYNMRIDVHSLNSRITKDGSTIITTSITVGGADHLAMVIHRLSNISGIMSIRRS